MTKLEVVESEITKGEDGTTKYSAIEAVHTRAEIQNVYDVSMQLKDEEVDDQW